MPMLISPRYAERDNQNSLRKFPFSDAASCTNGTCVIPPGAIVDAQLYVPGRETGRVWMSAIGDDGKVRFSDGGGEFAETSSPALPDMAIPVVFTGDGGPCPGGVVVFGHAAEVSALRAYGGQEFTSAQTELAPAAVSWPGMPGVLGFRLDDGNVVYGAVKMRGENGCVVSTYVEDGKNKLRISAIGRTVESSNATGFVTHVVAESDNIHFVVSGNNLSKVVDVAATGAEMTQDDGLVVGRDDLCAQVRKKVGSVPSALAASDGAACVCQTAATPALHTITLMVPTGDSGEYEIYGTENALQGVDIGGLTTGIPERDGKRFVGFFDVQGDTGGRRYYRSDGSGVGKFTAGTGVTLYARFIPAASSAAISFSGYGTLHLAARDTNDGYANPIMISGNSNPVPSVKEISASDLINGGADALADIVLHPSVPSGEVHIGIRGIGKASML